MKTMKKLMTIVAAALVMVGCNNAKTYVVEGHIDGTFGEVAVMNMAGSVLGPGIVQREL